MSEIINENSVEEGRLKAALNRKAKHAGKASGKRHKRKLKIGETASAGATGAGAVATVINPKTTKIKKRKGVVPNALDTGANLLGGQMAKR